METEHLSASDNRLRRRARHYLASGLMPAAQTALEALLQRQPNAALARIDLAGVLLNQGQWRSSIEQLRWALKTLPDDAALITQVATHLRRYGEVVAAREGLDRAASIANPSAQLCAEQAQLRWSIGEIEPALVLMEQAMAAGLDSPSAHYVYALLQLFSGHVERAGEVLDACLQRWPDFADAVVVLSGLRKQTQASNHVAAIQAQLQQLPQQPTHPHAMLARAEFESALFKELDDMGESAQAWPALARSARLMHALNPYDGAAEVAVTDTIIRIAQAIAADAPKLEHGFTGPTPIFIVGMTRSGTTLLERMLSSHSQVVSAGEINDFLLQMHYCTDVPMGGEPQTQAMLERAAQMDFETLGARYLEQTQWRAQGHRYYIDKLPMNMRLVAFIRRALPHAPILHMVREPMDVCYSNFKAMFGNNSAYSYDMHSLAHYYQQYARLADHWRASLPAAVLDVSYAQLVRDPAAALRPVLEICGLDMQAACLRPERNQATVATPSSVQVRQPIHTGHLGAWQRYATQLEPLRMALQQAHLLD